MELNEDVIAQPEEYSEVSTPKINTNTYLSLSVVFVLIAGGFSLFMWLSGQFTSARSEMTAQFSLLQMNQTKMQTDFALQAKDITTRIQLLEQANTTKMNEVWMLKDQWRFSDRLQKENDGLNGHPRIIVPEPDKAP